MARKPKHTKQPAKRIHWEQVIGLENLWPAFVKEQQDKGQFPAFDDAWLEESTGSLVIHLEVTNNWALYTAEGGYLGGSPEQALESPAAPPAGWLREVRPQIAPAVDGNGAGHEQATIPNDGEWTTHDDVEVDEALSPDESAEESQRLAGLIEEMTSLREERRRVAKSFNERIKEADEQSKAAAIAVKSGKRTRFVAADIIHDPAHGVKRLYFAGTQKLIREVPMTAEEIETASPLPPAPEPEVQPEAVN